MLIRNDEELAWAKSKAASLSGLVDQINNLLVEGGHEDLGGVFSEQMRRRAARLEQQIEAYEKLRELFARPLDLNDLAKFATASGAANPNVDLVSYVLGNGKTLFEAFDRAGFDLRFVVTTRSLEAAIAAAE